MDPQQVSSNFADINPPLTPEYACIESNRCLYCYDAPCTQACPTHINVPEFIRRIASGNLVGAAATILESNILGASCARVCPTAELCEGACVFHKLEAPPIEIGRLQRFAMDYVIQNDIPLLTRSGESPQGRVALIGAGPASLACAAELTKLGYKAVIFEARKEPGGLNRWGIAPYKITNEDALKEIDYIQRNLGFEIKTGITVGKDISVDDLLKDYDAIFLGMGLGGSRRLNIPGEDLQGVHGATEFIERLRSKPLHETKVPRKVIVVGAGNTAIDAATEAARLGASEVTIVYRRGKDEMPCYEFEYRLALSDGVRFLWHTQPLEIIGTEGRMIGLRCIRTRPGELDSSGRPQPIPVEGSDFTLEAEMLIKATGQTPQEQLLSSLEGVEVRGGKVKVNEKFCTGNPRIFAGGDCINGGKEVVNAVHDGMAAAQSIHESLSSRLVTAQKGER